MGLLDVIATLLYVIIRDFDEIVSRAYWMRKEREKERDDSER